MSHPILNIEALCIGHQQSLFDNIRLKIDNPGLAILSGPNGIGKSTLLKTITGLIPAISGQIEIMGERISSDKRLKLSRTVSYVGTERVRDDYITVLDLVRYGQFPYSKLGLPENAERHLDHVMELLNLNLISGKFLNTISDGEWQKANIARALVQDTPVIVMDEPSAFLDYPSKKKLYSGLSALAKSNAKLIICSTHDMELANAYGDYFWHMDLNGFQSSLKPFHWEL